MSCTDKTEKTVRVSFQVGRGRYDIDHWWLYNHEKNMWMKSNCYKSFLPFCSFDVPPGKYLLFSLYGYLDEREAEFAISEIIVSASGDWKISHTLFDIVLPYQYYCKICRDPSAPEIVRDFLAGRPKHFHSLPSNTPHKTYTAPLDISAIKQYFTQFVAKRRSSGDAASGE